MRVIALLLSPRYQLLSEAMPSTIVGTEGTIKVPLEKRMVLLYNFVYLVYTCACIFGNKTGMELC
jgi:hypothetical protein